MTRGSRFWPVYSWEPLGGCAFSSLRTSSGTAGAGMERSGRLWIRPVCCNCLRHCRDGGVGTTLLEAALAEMPQADQEQLLTSLSTSSVLRQASLPADEQYLLLQSLKASVSPPLFLFACIYGFVAKQRATRKIFWWFMLGRNFFCSFKSLSSSPLP